MKRLFAIILAVAMAASFSVVAFADRQVYDGVADAHRNTDGEVLIYRKVEGNFGAINMTGFPTFPADYGESVYIVLCDADRQFISGSEVVDGLKVTIRYEQGEELVEYAKLVKICDSGSSEYVYAVEMKIADKPGEVNESDIIATLEFNKSKKGSWKYENHPEYDVDGDEEVNFKVKDLEVDIAFSVGRLMSYRSFPAAVITSSSFNNSVIPNMHHVFKYDYDDEVEFEFGTEPNEGSFTVDVSGQGKTDIYFNTDLDDAIAAANPNANLIALNFNGCKFNRSGVFSYEAEKMNYAYAIRDGKLVLIGKFDDGVFEYNTNRLERCVFSDIELKQPQSAIAEMTYRVEWPTAAED